MKRFFTIFAVICTLSAIVIFRTTNKADAISSATTHISNNLKLPKVSENYKVMAVKGLKNYAVKYSDSFHRGGEIIAIEGIQQLKKWNIDTIISITPTDQERALSKQFGIRLVELQFTNDNLPHSQIDKFCAAVDSSQKCYIHCHGGTHRAGSLGIVYRMKKQGWNFAKAKTEFIALGGYPQKDKPLLDSIQSYMEGER